MRILYTTLPTKKSANEFAKKIILQKLAACVNIYPMEASYYLWKNKLQKEKEFALVMKTSAAQVEDLRSFLEENHPYEVPCLIEFSPEKVNAEYWNWVNTTL